MAVLTVTPLARAGVTRTLAAAAGGGDSFFNDGMTWVEIDNGGGSSINVTVASQVPAASPGQAVASDVIAVPAGAKKLIGPFSTSAYNDGNGRVVLTYSAVTSVTVGAFKLA